MRFLLVAPVAEASGESLAAVAASGDLLDRGHDVAWLFSALAERRVPEHLRGSGTHTLTGDRDANIAAWQDLVGGFRPDVVVFADYPLLFLSSTACPLWTQEQEEEFIGPWSSGAQLFTFDHLGLSQISESVTLGPLPSSESMTRAVLPRGMQVLLPCPLHEPHNVAGSHTGIACRGPLAAPSLPYGERVAIRAQHGRTAQRVILHAVPGWACKLARAFGGDYYTEFGWRLLDALPDSSTLISINDGSLLAPSHRSGVDVVNLAPVGSDTFDALLRSVDLFITDNPISSSLGRAISSEIPACVCYLWAHGGPPGGWTACAATADQPSGGASYDLFPIFPKGEIRKLGVVATARTVTQCFSEVNLANVAASGETIAQLLTFAPRRDALRVAQERYNRAVSALPSPGMAMLDRQC